MPRCNGVEATERLRRLRPEVAVVVLTTFSDDAWVFSALQAGARGFLTKDAGADEIRRAITDVAAGQAQLDPSVQRRLLDALGSGNRFAVADARGQQRPGDAPDELTPREAEVLAHIAAGLSNAEIASTPVRVRGHREDARQPHLRQDRPAGPGPARGLRVPQRPGQPGLRSPPTG